MSESYDAIKEWHQIAEKRKDENRLVCTNASVWEYFPGFATVIRRWNEDDLIKLKRIKDPEYPWRLINVSRQESVDAKLIKPGR